jgi:hypothetical protein
MEHSDDPLGELGDDPELARLGRHMRSELRAEAEEYEALAAQDRLRRRHLAEAAVEWLHRGDVVAVHTSTVRFTGEVAHVGDDFLSLHTPAAAVDVNLARPLSVQVVHRAARGGRSLRPGATTLAARLSEHEAAGDLVDVGVALPAVELKGRIAAAARDHVVLVDLDGGEWYVAVTAVDYVAAGAPG